MAYLMRRNLPYPFQYVWFLVFVILFITSTYFAAESLSVIFLLQQTSFAGLTWDIPILLDTIRLLFARTVALISRAIFTFGATYIRGEPIVTGRFWSLVIIFVLSMFVVIFVPNLLIIILGWDGLGVTSFLLVIHYQNTASLYGGYITILSNRAGDAILFLVIGILARSGNRYHILLFSDRPGLTSLSSQIISMDYIILTLLSFAAYRKRAQAPFLTWLPEAMAAPTPVSALVHSSTLVTAGIYLLIRTYDFWSSWSLAAVRVTATGIVTILIGGGKATIEGDVKKTIAFSTIRQLGYIVTIIGLGHPSIAFFHLITHALFKSTIFIRAGVIFTYGHHYQTYDQWNSKWHVPLAGAGLAISLAAINVFPFLAGIYSKELIVSTFTAQASQGRHVVMFLLAAGTMFIAASQTIIYTVRLWRGLFFTKYTARAYYFIEKPAYRPDIYTSDNNMRLRIPFLTLIIGTATAGRVVMWVILTPADLSPITWIVKVAVLVSIISGIISAFMPCRGVTKIRVNQRVLRVRSKHGSIASWRGNRKKKLGIWKSKHSNFICSGVRGDVSHIYEQGQFFMDRTLLPVYRLFYTSTKLITLIEQGLLQLWSLRGPNKRGREVSLISQNVVKHVNSYLGISILGLGLIILFVLFYSSLI